MAGTDHEGKMGWPEQAEKRWAESDLSPALDTATLCCLPFPFPATSALMFVDYLQQILSLPELTPALEPQGHICPGLRDQRTLSLC